MSLRTPAAADLRRICRRMPAGSPAGSAAGYGAGGEHRRPPAGPLAVQRSAGNTRIVDRIGNNTGTLQNGASLVASGIPNAGAGNRAARFQGNDDHMSISIQSLPTLDVAKSIALWINPDTLSHTGMRTILAMSTDDDHVGDPDRDRPRSAGDLALGDLLGHGAGQVRRALDRSAGITWSTPTTR